MACSDDELVIPEEVPRMAVKKENAGETLFVVDIPNTTSGDLEEEVAAFIKGFQKLVMDKDDSTNDDKFLSIFNDGKPIYTGKLPSAKDNIHKEKTDKEPLETGEAKTGKEAVADLDENQTERSNKALAESLEVQTRGKERSAESDPAPAAVVNGTHELSDDYISFILSMPTETPFDTEDNPFMTSNKHDLAKLLNRSEEWVEEQRQWFKEDAAYDQKIYDDFEPLKKWLRDEFFDKGCIKVDEEYLNQVAELEEYGKGLWDDFVKERGGFAGVKFADPNDPMYAEWYSPEEVCAPPS